MEIVKKIANRHPLIEVFYFNYEGKDVEMSVDHSIEHPRYINVLYTQTRTRRSDGDMFAMSQWISTELFSDLQVCCKVIAYTLISIMNKKGIK